MLWNKLWKLRNLTIEGGIVVFKPLAISKLIHLALVTDIPATTINLLKYKWNLYGKGKIQKSKIILYAMTTNLVDKKILISFQKL